MKKNNLKSIATFLIIMLLFNFIIIGFAGNSYVQAGFWDNNKNSIFTFVKGLIMLWIINLITSNTQENEDNTLASTIREGLDIPDSDFDSFIPEVEIVSPDQEQQTNTLTSREQYLLELINRERKQREIPVLSVDLELVAIARQKAQDMVANDYFDHYSPHYGSPFDMLRDREINYLLATENLAGAQSVDEAMESLLASEEHKDNILDSRYNKIGMGIVEGGPHGLIVVQLFVRL